MKSFIQNIEGVDYLSFRPNGLSLVTIPVTTKGSRDKQNSWSWNGDLENPTVRPSIRTEYWKEPNKPLIVHYWLNDGICQCLSDCTDGNSGKNLGLEDVSEYKN